MRKPEDSNHAADAMRDTHYDGQSEFTPDWVEDAQSIKLTDLSWVDELLVGKDRESYIHERSWCGLTMMNRRLNLPCPLIQALEILDTMEEQALTTHVSLNQARTQEVKRLIETHLENERKKTP